MKTIICPTDFSSPAINAIEYAAKFAPSIHVELKIVNVQLAIPVGVLESGGVSG